MSQQDMKTLCCNTLNGPATLCVVAILGAIFLHRLAERVAQPSTNRPMHLASLSKSEVLSIYAPAKLIEFARTQVSHKASDDLPNALRAANLSDCWYAVDIADTMNDGTIYVLTRVAYPGRDSQQVISTPVLLSALAGKPMSSPKIDYRPAEIVVIDDSYLQGDPFETMKDLDEIRVASRLNSTHVSCNVGFRTAQTHEDD